MRNHAGDGLQQPSLVELAADSLRRRILGGDLKPGERLKEEQLTEELGISRPPLREAMRLLEQEGLITKLPRYGAQVVSLTAHDIWELLTLRQSLEVLALTLAMPVSEEGLAEPRQLLADMETCAKDNSRAGMVDAGFQFHLSLVGLAGHSRISAVYRSLQAQLQLCMAVNTEASHEPLPDNVARHRQLLDAIATGDLALALAALNDHGHGAYLEARRADS
ncbi:GntR family transcriptional regulator [Trebonia kvetii]|uniref:GntR family transcriptional regulator n=1 Tax=Trebonia kvetii TaxID=2480626 RepID=A0A6P2BKG1_9ACTN|nr:GntR family transcriptional regulator [Trebonia kvetii]TVY98978.1 GntR family transcriptional regulator [Trebonia kvetii]